MSKKLFFVPIDDLPLEYVRAKMSSMLEQIGIGNIAVLKLTSAEFGSAELADMQGPGCILHFADSHDGCSAIAVVLYCDYYQIAAGNVFREAGKVYFEVQKLYPDTDCFSLNDVLGSIRGIKLPYRYKSETRCETSQNGVFLMEVTGKHVRNP